MATLNAVHSVAATADDGLFIVNCNVTDDKGATYDCDYVTNATDPHGLNPTVWQWLQDHEGEYSIQPYVPPTIEQIRAAMLPVTARQLRLTLVRNGFSLSSIDTAIAALPAGQEKDEAAIEWEYATQFNRLAPTLLTIAAALSVSAEDIDTMWQQALAT